MLENTGTSITVYVCFRGSQKDTKQRLTTDVENQILPVM